jgi:MFS family permease
MIQTTAFLAAFAVQIVVVSVLHPVWFSRYLRARAEVQMPDWDRAARARFFSRYRAANFVIAVFGVALFGWLVTYLERPDWNFVTVIKCVTWYAWAQMLPFALTALAGLWFKQKALRHALPASRRTASLARRSLFDIVPPVIVGLAVLAYGVFAALVIHVGQHPFPQFAGYLLLRNITLTYIFLGFVVYWQLYRRRKWPLETRAFRDELVAVQVRMVFYSAIAVALFWTIHLTLNWQHLQRWRPLAVSVYIVIIMLLSCMVLLSLRRRAEEDRRELEEGGPDGGPLPSPAH